MNRMSSLPSSNRHSEAGFQAQECSTPAYEARLSSDGRWALAEGLERIHGELEGLGCLPVFAGSRNLRDADSGVRIEFLMTGQFSGDGKPKPVAFPDPYQMAIDKAGAK